MSDLSFKKFTRQLNERRYIGPQGTVEYKKLSPKMKDAIDEIFRIMDSKPSDFLNTFEKTIREVSKKFKVSERELMNYFEKEMLSI